MPYFYSKLNTSTLNEIPESSVRTSDHRHHCLCCDRLVMAFIGTDSKADKRNLHQHDPDGNSTGYFLHNCIGGGRHGDMKKVGRVGLKALIYFEVITTLALVIGLLTANIVKPGASVTFTQTSNSQVEEFSGKASEINWGEFSATLYRRILWKLLQRVIFFRSCFLVFCLP